ncbi:acetate kinase [Candidatus Aerophobetes bacterium]|uniref:Acetate kinase n=1 Tax=Aerophobetes bacterium TaxID=2030807 RepID=A0A2A4X0Y9_UNCAE|nr:MAG: acetate kinase [Candidatus Aerophobetes bacterium]
MSKKAILVFNCGSSSIKAQVVDPVSGVIYFKVLCEEVGSKGCFLTLEEEGEKVRLECPMMDYGQAIDKIVSQMSASLKSMLVGVGHRVVHGGSFFTLSTRIDANVASKIKECIPLAPLHNSYNLLGIEKLQKAFSHLPHVAVFDTAFHATLPKYAHIYPLDFLLYEKHQIKKYGFHGTSHRYVTQMIAEKMGKSVENTRFISAHLGGGCSLCAISGGKSIETSMGFSPAEGLMMATRSGDIDPTLFSFLHQTLGMSMEEVVAVINKKSGLLGVSGISGDLRDIEKGVDEGNERAILAFEMFCYRLSKMIASYFIIVPGMDALIFTGGIGENSDRVRQRVCSWLKPLGVSMDMAKNRVHGKGYDGEISDEKSSFTVCVQPTNEELLIAQDTFDLSRD